MEITGFDHVQLAMPPGGEESARSFYGGLLGLSSVEKPPHLAARGGCWFETPALRLHLGVEDGFRPARKAHPAFAVTGLSSLVATLRTAGVEVVLDEDPADGLAHVYVDDPFGNRLELVERTS
jgi:catechol 2,3-dioxygenase-like lactoylglutathione lyase family enzyme